MILKTKRIMAFALISTLFFAVLASIAPILTNNPIQNNPTRASTCITHDGNHYDYLAPTCEDDGHYEYWVCCVCHESFLSNDTVEIENGVWNDCGTHVDGVIADKALIPALGHDFLYESVNSETHRRTCQRQGCDHVDVVAHDIIHHDMLPATCLENGYEAYDECEHCSYTTGITPIPAAGHHDYTSEVIEPYGERRGYTQYTCENCGDTYEDSWDFSNYEGVTFTSTHNKYLIPYSFNSDVFTVEASFKLPTNHNSRGGVILGNYGLNSALNIEINSSGQLRLYFMVIVNDAVVERDYHFNADLRSDDEVKNIAVVIKSSQTATLFIDGVQSQQININVDIPNISRTWTIGGDNRAENSAYFRGRLYSLSIFRDERTAQEIKDDIILADKNDLHCCVSYNLIDESYLSDESDPADDPFEYSEVSNADELEYHCSIGTEYIKVVSNITLDRTIYAVGHPTIYSDSNYSITRASDFAGDMFVFGENRYGRNLILDGVECNVTFGKDNATGTLTIDGNKNNLENDLEVYGSVVYISYSATFNLRDHAIITNNKKVQNYRTQMNDDSAIANRAIGGAGVLIYTGTFNMYGGSISNCEVNDYDVADGDTESDVYRASTYGGAIFNYSNFNMYGGTITSNHAYYGAAIANYKIMHIYAGTISNNSTTYAGGALYQVSSTHAQCYIGTDENALGVYDVIFSGNSSTASAGGACYSGTLGNVHIYGSTKFINNTSFNRGGAVAANGYLSIDSNTLFQSNSASHQYGGAISLLYEDTAELDRRECTFTGVTFTGNSAPTGGAYGTNGGDATFTSCTFANNSSTSNGGVAYLYFTTATEYGSDTEFNNCTFTGNTSGAEAGAISIDRGCDLVVDHCTFTSNTSSSNGGAICSHGANSIAIDDSTFDENSAFNGGALYFSVRTKVIPAVNPQEEPTQIVYETTATVEDSNFSDNSVTNFGGAVYLYASANNHKTATFSNCDFDSNSAYLETDVLDEDGITVLSTTISGSGGAIYASNADFDFTNGDLTNNNAGDRGGALFVTNATVDLSYVTGSGNTSTQYGGFAYVVSGNADASSLVITNSSCTFSSNESMYGGAISLHGTNTTGSIIGATFSQNETTANGGAIYLAQSTLTGSDLAFTNNSSTSSSNGGGAIYGTAATATLTGVTFTGNSATKYGGAVLANTNSEINLYNVTASGNSAGNKGGFAFAYNGGVLNISTSGVGVTQINSNTAVAGGGALYADVDGEINVSNTTLNLNVSTSASGGAIYVNDGGEMTLDNVTVSNSSASNGAGLIVYGGTLTVTDSAFTSNSSSSWGGAMYIRSGATAEDVAVVDISDTTFTSNSGSAGGAIYVNVHCDVSLDGCTFTTNTSIGYGGAINLASSAEITIANSSFIENTATAGGAVYANSSSSLTITGSTTNHQCSNVFSGNTTTTNGGGAIYMNTSSSFSIDNVEFVENSVKAGESGGAIYSYHNVTGTATDCVFTSNESSNGGAVIVNGSTNISFVRCDFDQNTSNNVGGAVYIRDYSTVVDEVTNVITAPVVSFNSCNFTSNTGTYGGAIYFNVNGTLTVTNSTFDSNTASIKAGAICTKVPTTVSGSTFSENASNGTNTTRETYGDVGGAIFADHNLTISGSTFSENTSAYRGGAIAYVGTSLNISSTSFTSNEAAGFGGAIYAFKDAAAVSAENRISITLTSTNFTTNNGSAGGALYLNNVDLTVNSGTYQGNTSSGDGSIMYVQVTSDVNIKSATFIGNVSSGNGGFYVNRSSLTINENGNGTVIFGTTDAQKALTDGNSADIGGAIYATVGAVVNINDTTFGYNSSTVTYAGAVGGFGGNNSEPGADVTITNSTFTHNTAFTSGGAIGGNNYATFTIEDCIFSYNTASSSNGYGGALYITGSAAGSISGSTFDHNSARYMGAAGCGSATTLTIDDCTFINNEGLDYAGAVGAISTSTLTLTDSSFTSNTAQQGGAIAILSTSASTSISGSTFTSNSATGTGGSQYGGGAIIINTTGTVGISACEFDSNTCSTKGGGAIRVLSSATVTIGGNSTFTENAATGKNGGAIYITGTASVTISNAEFSENTASSGGGITIEGGSLTITGNVTFDQNAAVNNGGAIYACGSPVVSITGATFTSNTAASGGAMRIGASASDALQFTATNCTFTSNSSTGNGGAAYMYAGNTNTLRFVGCTFTSNTAAGSAGGGAIYCSSATQLVLNNTIMRNNTVTGNGAQGGAIRFTNGSGVTTSLRIEGTYTTSGNEIYVSGASNTVTIVQTGLDDEDNAHASDTWNTFVKGTTSIVAYVDE